MISILLGEMPTGPKLINKNAKCPHCNGPAGEGCSYNMIPVDCCCLSCFRKQSGAGETSVQTVASPTTIWAKAEACNDCPNRKKK